jgi:hypothetical protein
MTNPKIRRLFILAHLWLAGFLAPAFLLVAISGGLYLLGNGGDFKSEPVSLPVGAALDFESPTLETDVRELLNAAEINQKFEYIRNRGTVIQLRPTSRTHLEFRQTDDGLTAIRKVPNFQGTLIELHKGHGPSWFKFYQKLVALGLIGVVFGGILVGFLAKAYRRQTSIAVVIGSLIFVFLAFFS